MAQQSAIGRAKDDAVMPTGSDAIPLRIMNERFSTAETMPDSNLA